MNQGQAVRVDAGLEGADIRVWVDDEAGHHLTVCSLHLSPVLVAAMNADIVDAQERALQLEFDLPWE